MPTKPDKSPEDIAFEIAQSQIRACVATPGCVGYFTWLRNGSVLLSTADLSEQVGYAVSLSDFNELLEKFRIAGLHGRAALRSKHREQLALATVDA